MELPRYAEEFRGLEEELEFQKDAFLRSRGWQRKCDNPAALWLWHKTITWETGRPGQRKAVTQEFTLPTNLALHLEDATEPIDDEGASE